MRRRHRHLAQVLAGLHAPQGNDDQGQDGGHQHPRGQGDGHALEDGIGENHAGTGHQGQGRDENGSGPGLTGPNHRLRHRDTLLHLVDREINEQDGVANDDAGQGYPADHGSGGEFPAHAHAEHEKVSRNDAQQGQGNRRHNDQGNTEVAKLPDHQDVDEHQGHGEGRAHVAEGLVGDGPLASPLPGGVAVVGRGLGPVTQRRHAIGSLVAFLVQNILDLQHAIDGRGQFPSHIRHHILDRAQVLAVDDVLLGHPLEAA